MVLGSLRALLGCPWEVLERSWGGLGALLGGSFRSWGALGGSWGALGGVLGGLGALLERHEDSSISRWMLISIQDGLRGRPGGS